MKKTLMALAALAIAFGASADKLLSFLCWVIVLFLL